MSVEEQVKEAVEAQLVGSLEGLEALVGRELTGLGYYPYGDTMVLAFGDRVLYLVAVYGCDGSSELELVTRIGSGDMDILAEARVITGAQKAAIQEEIRERAVERERRMEQALLRKLKAKYEGGSDG